MRFRVDYSNRVLMPLRKFFQKLVIRLVTLCQEIFRSCHEKEFNSMSIAVIGIGIEGLVKKKFSDLARTSKNKNLKAPLIYFQEMCRRGVSSGPKSVCDMLVGSGVPIKWPNPSHIAAFRD